MADRVIRVNGEVFRTIFIEAMSEAESFVRARLDDAEIQKVALECALDLSSDDCWGYLRSMAQWMPLKKSPAKGKQRASITSPTVCRNV